VKLQVTRSMFVKHDDKFLSGESREESLLGFLRIPVSASFISFEYGGSDLSTPLFRLPGRPEVLVRANVLSPPLH